MLHPWKDYQSLSACQNIASSTDCVIKANAGLCNQLLSDGNRVSFYCGQACGLCSQSAIPTSGLTCTNLVKTCNTGTCSAVTYFSVSTIKCTCPSTLAGAYCQRGFCSFIPKCFLTLLVEKISHYSTYELVKFLRLFNIPYRKSNVLFYSKERAKMTSVHANFFENILFFKMKWIWKIKNI